MRTAIGNHEFDVGPDFTARFITDHRINGVLNQPFLTANVDFTPSSAFDTLLDADGLIIGSTSDGRVVASSKIVIDEAPASATGSSARRRPRPRASRRRHRSR